LWTQVRLVRPPGGAHGDDRQNREEAWHRNI